MILETKNLGALTLKSKVENEITWNEADFTWDEQTSTWDNIFPPLTLETKNITTLNLETK